MVKDGNTTVWRLQCLEKQVNDIDGKVEQVLQNQLPHLNEGITSLKTRINVLSAVNIGAIIAGLLIAKYL